MWHKNFTIVLSGQLISQLGNAILRVAMALHILETTKSAALFSMLLAISMVPYVIGSPFAGHFADTMRKKHMMVGLDVFSGFVMLAYLVALPHSNSVVLTGTVMFILSVIFTLYQPVVQTSLPFVAEDRYLARANALVQQVVQAVNLAGPVLAGLIYGLFGLKAVILINLLSFWIAAVMECFLDIDDGALVTAQRRIEASPLREMLKSVHYIRSGKPTVLRVIGMFALTNVFVVPVLSIVTPYFVNVFMAMPSEIYGTVEAISVTGMLVGSSLIWVIPRFFTMRHLHQSFYPLNFAMLGAAMIALFSQQVSAGEGLVWVLMYAACGFLIMMSLAISNVVAFTFIQKEVAPSMLGKVSAFSTAVATVSIMPGQLIYGTLIESAIPLHMLLGVSFLLSLGVTVYVKRISTISSDEMVSSTK